MKGGAKSILHIKVHYQVCYGHLKKITKLMSTFFKLLAHMEGVPD